MYSEIKLLQVQPGLCPIDPGTGLPLCPAPTEIDSVRVKKVFSQSFLQYVEEIEIPFDAPTLEIITADAQEAEFVSSEITILDCSAISDDIVRITYILEATCRVPLDAGGYEVSSETKVIPKHLYLHGASEAVLDLENQILTEHLHSFITQRDDIGNVTQVRCILRVCIFLRTTAEVQLLIPAYGICQPSECGIIPSCPPLPPLDC